MALALLDSLYLLLQFREHSDYISDLINVKKQKQIEEPHHSDHSNIFDIYISCKTSHLRSPSHE